MQCISHRQSIKSVRSQTSIWHFFLFIFSKREKLVYHPSGLIIFLSIAVFSHIYSYHFAFHYFLQITRSLILITYTIHLVQPLAISPLWNGLTGNDRSTAAKERGVRSVSQGKNKSKVKQQSVSTKLTVINHRKATIFCECRLSLAIMDNGDVRGLQNGSSSANGRCAMHIFIFSKQLQKQNIIFLNIYPCLN